jgi:predicted XRE-type DNA-binding protein
LKNSVKKRSNKLITHRTGGSILDELEVSAQQRLELKLKADLHQDILKRIKKKRFTPRQLEKVFDIPQPRVSELLRGKLSLLSVSKLLYYAHLLGAQVHVQLKTSGRNQKKVPLAQSKPPLPSVVVSLTRIHRLRDERLPKGPASPARRDTRCDLSIGCPFDQNRRS